MIIHENFNQVIRRTISKETSEIMKQMMLDVIKQYTGYYAFIPGYEVGGKTGTTQKYAEGKISGEYIASFVGVFPAKNPDYVMLVIADEPGGDSYYGSVVATPYAKMIIEDIIKYKNYEPLYPDEIENNPLEEKVIMPNIMGLNTYTAIETLQKIGLQVEVQGDNDIVTRQFPIEGTSIIKNGIVVITAD